MNFIKKLFENKIDEDVHRQFKRFGKGTYENRALVDMTVSNNIKIKTSFEFTNEFVRLLVNTIKDKVHITGGIITTKDLKNEGLDFVNVKQFAGVKTYQVDCEISKDSLLHLLDSYPDAVFCLSFSTSYGSLKTKVKTPKSSKPGKDEEKIKIDYCTFVTKDLDFKKEFAFDIKEDFKKFLARHTITIEGLVVPKQYENDPVSARIYAKRKGKIIRTLEFDNKKAVKEIDFEA